MRVFVTGASGFVGSKVVAELCAAGHSVLGLARSDASAAAIHAAGAEVHRGDLTQPETLRSGATQADAVIHLALIVDLPRRLSMVRRFCATFLVLAAAGCGARSELGDEAATCTQLDIGIFGNPGAYSSSDDFQQWLTMSGAAVQRIQTTPGEPVTAATLQPFDVVVLDWLTRDYTTSEAATFAAWVAAGGGVASMSGYDAITTDDWHANSLLAPLEIAYGGPLLSGPITDFAAHPITAGLTSVVFTGGYAVSDLGGHASARTPIAFLPVTGGDVNVGYAIQMGAGRAFVWGDEWIEFTTLGSFPPQIWVQAFAWISPANKCALTPPS